MEKPSESSKTYLSEALFALLQKKPLKEITNKEITDKAGFSHITIYRNFPNKEAIVAYYLKNTYKRLKDKWQNDADAIYQIFTFFYKQKEIIEILYRNDLEHLLLSSLLESLEYRDNDDLTSALAKKSLAYLLFAWCDEWYLRGMKPSPEKMAALFKKARENDQL